MVPFFPSRTRTCEGFGGMKMIKEKQDLYTFQTDSLWKTFLKMGRITTRSLEARGLKLKHLRCQANRLQSNLSQNMQMENEMHMSELVQERSLASEIFWGKCRVWSGDMFRTLWKMSTLRLASALRTVFSAASAA